MLLNRSTGINGLCAFCLLALVTLSFWSWLFIWENTLFSDRMALEKYSFYNEFLLIGVLFRLDGRRLAQGPYHEFVEAVRRSGRQAIMGLFAVFIVVFALQDTFISRAFLFSYIPWLCVTLVFANYLVPKWLSHWVFGVDRPERVALAGTPEQAAKIKPWLDRKRMIGLHTIGLIRPKPGVTEKTTNHIPDLPMLGSLDELREILQKESISQLIVMDLSLPIIDGWEATRRLKDDERTRHIPVLALTGHAPEGLAGHSEGAHAAGCDAFLAKPCSPEALLELVKDMLARRGRGVRKARIRARGARRAG